jgi:hypothetical protein
MTHELCSSPLADLGACTHIVLIRLGQDAALMFYDRCEHAFELVRINRLRQVMIDS